MTPDFTDPAVLLAYDAFPPDARKGAEALRALIYEVAASLPDCPEPTECLRWGQPSYVTPKGTALRIGIPKEGGFGLYAHCQTTVISDFAQTSGQAFTIQGNRGVLFRSPADIKPDLLRQMIAHALMYKA